MGAEVKIYRNLYLNCNVNHDNIESLSTLAFSLRERFRDTSDDSSVFGSANNPTQNVSDQAH